MTDASEFAIVCQARTGSNMLVGRLDRLPGVVCHAELFHRQQPFTDMPAEHLPPEALRRRAPVAYWDRVAQSTREWSPDACAIGFKLFFTHSWRMHREIARRRMPVVLLRRNSRLSQYSSFKIALQTNRWSSRQTDGNAATPRVRFSAAGFLLFTLRSRMAYTAYRCWLLVRRVPCLYISYEALVHEPDAFARVCRFIGAEERADSESSYRRQNPGSVLERFNNPGYARVLHTMIRRLGLD